MNRLVLVGIAGLAGCGGLATVCDIISTVFGRAMYVPQ